jgi:hypothetical protein
VLAGGGQAHLVGDEIAQRADDNGALRLGNHQREGSVDSLMSEKIIHLARRRPKGRNLPGDVPAEPVETKGDELAIFMLHPDGGSIWLSDDLRSREQCYYVIDFLDRARARMIELCDAT